MRAVANVIIGELIPPEAKYGELFLPDNFERYSLTAGEALQMKVTHVGPEVKYVKPGMIVMLDPSRVRDEGRAFRHDGAEYAAVPEDYFDWMKGSGYLFPVYKDYLDAPRAGCSDPGVDAGGCSRA